MVPRLGRLSGPVLSALLQQVDPPDRDPSPTRLAYPHSRIRRVA
jgi:hypothetical protein